MTLPLIAVLKNVTPSDRRWMLRIVKKHNKNSEKVNELIQFVKDKGGLEYTRQKMIEYKEKAMAILQDFPDSETKLALETMVEYTISRSK